MTQEHPITPSIELVYQWTEGWNPNDNKFLTEHVVKQAARWGADQQLEQDAKWLDGHALFTQDLTITPPGDALRKVMRPKLLSLKEQALQALYRFDNTQGHADLTLEQIEEDFVVIRRALESLPD